MTALLGLLPLALSQQQIVLRPAPSLVWGSPSHDLRLGFTGEDQKGGPAIWRTWLKNESDHPMVVVMGENQDAPPTPVFILISQANNKMKWTVTPPTAYPADTFGSAWEIRVPAHGTAPIMATQFRYPVPVGKYSFGCRFAAMVKVDAPGEAPFPVSLDSVYCTEDIPATQIARAAGF